MTLPASESIRTPTVLPIAAVCPRCGEGAVIFVGLTAQLTITTEGSELKIKAKSKGRAHVCGQLALEEAEQPALPLEDADPPSADDDDDSPCPFPGCVLLVDHIGPHTFADAGPDDLP